MKGHVSEEELHFIGILSNVSSSVSRLKLGHGFKLGRMRFEDVCEFLSQVCHISEDAVAERFISSGIGSDFCVVSKTHVVDPQLDDPLARHRCFTSFIDNEIRGHLAGRVNLMRLFKEGNVQMPLEFIHTIVGNEPSTIYEVTRGYSNRFGGKYKLTEKEVQKLQRFIRRIKIPFSHSYLRVAFESFEQSYDAPDLYGNHNLVFLSLMIGLETLLNPDPQELRYRISRNASVLLGRSERQCRQIFKDVRRLYDIRSEIVHNGKTDLVSEVDVMKLRDFVRSAILNAYEMHMEKACLVDELNTRGFEPG